jgi:hypothetical protein
MLWRWELVTGDIDPNYPEPPCGNDAIPIATSHHDVDRRAGMQLHEDDYAALYRLCSLHGDE